VISETTRMTYGNSSMRRQHGLHAALGELAVADLATLRRTHAAGLADRERREVVVQQERLLVGLAFRRIDDLLVAGGAERGTTSAWVSPRVNSAEPWVRGSTPTRQVIGRTSSS
jgi:hypothetical protein